jgi:hypothetical protein
MRGFKVLMLAAAAASCLAAAPARVVAGVSIDIGLAPACPYGYYDAAPYQCAPSGYYGPEWFSGDVFVGAGPWFHGPSNFRGNVNRSYHPANGYHGPMPNRGEKFDPTRRVDKEHFKGNEERDGRGHVSEPRH